MYREFVVALFLYCKFTAFITFVCNLARKSLIFNNFCL